MERIGLAVAEELGRIREVVHPTEGVEMSTTQTESETEIVTGRIHAVVPKGDGKWQVEVDSGGQHPRKLWTKDQGIAQTMDGMRNQTLSFMCGKSHWTMNDGTPVTSLWINGYGAPDALQNPAVPAVPQPPMQQPVPPQQGMQPQAPAPQSMNAWQPTAVEPMGQPVQSSTEDKIHRQTATKVAVQLLKHLQPADQTYDVLIRISERLCRYYENGVASDFSEHPGLSAHDDGIPF